VENLVTRFDWAGRSVFVTGHTGFKGSWLSMWLGMLGARVTGYALAPETTPSMFVAAGVAAGLAAHHEADVRHGAALCDAMVAAAPELVLHLAAQPLVRRAYREPVDTWSTNVMGTVNVLEAARACPSVRAVVVVTTDKCYENQEWLWGYRETDRLGGRDPYSASKAAAELVVESYRKSFFQASGVLVASARAGNVIGGGDFSEDRLVPDAARAVQAGRPLSIRNPEATRPWQHVLESLRGYLQLSERLLDGEVACADAFNFGPVADDNLPVGELLTGMRRHWPDLEWQVDRVKDAPHEAGYLYLDATKARRELGWQPRWSLDAGLAHTATWYRAWLKGEDLAALSRAQILAYGLPGMSQ
jgi:CDP-glucose 4,6-dehydratase